MGLRLIFLRLTGMLLCFFALNGVLYGMPPQGESMTFVALRNALLEEDNLPLRQVAAQSLMHYRGEQATTLIGIALDDPDESVVQLAIEAYLNYPGPDRFELEEIVRSHPSEMIQALAPTLSPSPRRRGRTLPQSPFSRSPSIHIHLAHDSSSSASTPSSRDLVSPLRILMEFPELARSFGYPDLPMLLENQGVSSASSHPPSLTALAELDEVQELLGSSWEGFEDFRDVMLGLLVSDFFNPGASNKEFPKITLDPTVLRRKRSNVAGLDFPVPPVPELLILKKTALSRLEDRLAQRYVVSGIFDLAEDYHAAQEVLDLVKSAPVGEPGQYRVNWDYLAMDPYLSFHEVDIHQAYPENISDREWAQMESHLKSAAQVEAVTEDLDRVFSILEFRVLETQAAFETKLIQRKRMKRLYDERLKRAEKGEVGRFAQTPLGDLAIELAQNRDRCMDGLSDAMTAIERNLSAEKIGDFKGNPNRAGVFISQVLTDYKMDFIEKLSQLKPESSEFQTTVRQILRQRMLYALGLRGAEMQIDYPDFGNPYEKALQPASVMALFLAGGEVHLESLDSSLPTIQFEPYTVEKILQLLQASRERALVRARKTGGIASSGLSQDLQSYGRALSHAELTEMALGDEFLAARYRSWIEVSGGAAHDLFFIPPREGEDPAAFRLTDQFWLYQLEKTGFIVRTMDSHTGN
ncbi:MAG: hypothetical protein ACO3A2_06625 [Bdellovibrionia bacterium]